MHCAYIQCISFGCSDQSACPLISSMHPARVGSLKITCSAISQRRKRYRSAKHLREQKRSSRFISLINCHQFQIKMFDSCGLRRAASLAKASPERQVHVPYCFNLSLSLRLGRALMERLLAWLSAHGGTYRRFYPASPLSFPSRPPFLLNQVNQRYLRTVVCSGAGPSCSATRRISCLLRALTRHVPLLPANKARSAAIPSALRLPFPLAFSRSVWRGSGTTSCAP